MIRTGWEKIRWGKIRGPRAVIGFACATSLGAGLFPFAPGTMGALFGLPLAYALASWGSAEKLFFWLALTALGTWAAKVTDETMGSSDNGCIVLDEVIGLGITAWTAGTHGETLAAAFVLFRFFDIVKPFPVRALDRWSKKKAAEPGALAKWWGGFGVMADDVVAGFQGLAIVLFLQHFGLLP